ncbi:MULTISPECIES: hypothetical protein [Arenibacter]|uniref:hypothetical protein n=1 Tax=Arenibacter TaxID=178469 RepID=UPI00130005BC|nr:MULTISPECIES: hypothetical protein [Arenibacter]
MWLGRKRASGFHRLCFSAAEEVGQNWNGKTSQADQLSVSAWGGLERKGCPTSAGIGNLSRR